MITGVGSGGSEAAFTLFPNPGNGLFTLRIQTVHQETLTIQVLNSLGAMIREYDGMSVKGIVDKVIDLRPATDGIYTLVIRSSSTLIVKKAVVRN